MQSSTRGLDWANQPLPFKIYTTLAPLVLTQEFKASPMPALAAIAGLSVGPARVDRALLARLCYFSNGVTRVLRGMPFRAAACTGALYHIELYLICADLEDLEAGVYHYGAHDNALRQLRRGDFRAGVGQAPVTLAFTTTYWRNAWKYQARAYRHAFWDSGTILANLFSIATAAGLTASLRVGFVDRDVNTLLDVDPLHEAAVALVALGAETPTAPVAPPVTPLGLETRQLSAHEVDYPLIREAHAASSLESVAGWPGEASPTAPHPPLRVGLSLRERRRAPASGEGGEESIESVILRRGSSRRFRHDAITRDQMMTLLEVSTQPVRSDTTWPLTDPYVIVNAVDDLASGIYAFNRATRELELLESGVFRREAAFLSLGQALAGDAAINVYWLTDLRGVVQRLGNRGYRAAELEAAIEGGKLYLAAYALGLGATGLTFFDDDVVGFFSPHAAGKDVMFLTAVGLPAAPSRVRR